MLCSSAYWAWIRCGTHWPDSDAETFSGGLPYPGTTRHNFMRMNDYSAHLYLATRSTPYQLSLSSQMHPLSTPDFTGRAEPFCHAPIRARRMLRPRTSQRASALLQRSRGLGVSPDQPTHF